MAESPKRTRGCFKMGCFGCLALLGGGLIVGGCVAGLTVLENRRSPERQQTELLQELPQVERPKPAEPAREVLDRSAFEIDAADVSEPGRVILDLTDGDFVIEPGEPGAPIRVEADFDKVGFELTESYEAYGETGWIYRLGYRRKSMFRFVMNQGEKNVRVILPRDVPLTLEGEIGRGQSRVELGGLWLLETDLELGAGDHEVSFRDPLLAPMGRFVVEGSMGKLDIRGLGNASPESVQVGHSMGALTVDLRGPWARDATVSASGSMGEMNVRLPADGVAFDVRRVGVFMGGENRRGLRDAPRPQLGMPTLSLTLKHTMGHLNVER